MTAHAAASREERTVEGKPAARWVVRDRTVAARAVKEAEVWAARPAHEVVVALAAAAAAGARPAVLSPEARGALAARLAEPTRDAADHAQEEEEERRHNSVDQRGRVLLAELTVLGGVDVALGEGADVDVEIIELLRKVEARAAPGAPLLDLFQCRRLRVHVVRRRTARRGARREHLDLSFRLDAVGRRLRRGRRARQRHSARNYEERGEGAHFGAKNTITC